MRILERVPRIRTLPDPRQYQQFAGFTSGDGHHERGVDNLVHRQHQGIANNAATMVVMEDPLSEELMGTCGHRPEQVTFSALPKGEPLAAFVPRTDPTLTTSAVYVHVICLCKGFRGCRLPDGTRLGSFLLRGMMKEVARGYITSPLPIMFAYVAVDNIPSHRVFEGEGFGLIAPRRQGEETVRYRPGGLEIR